MAIARYPYLSVLSARPTAIWTLCRPSQPASIFRHNGSQLAASDTVIVRAHDQDQRTLVRLVDGQQV
ncbi:hypothetical protein ABIB57_000934 [Devosia sp. UYZn731]|uniref:hypothetical protein n=1 Tax=Devosia sp. UYZn731 TaxID=3156345 RepID=UPI0033930A2E